MKLSPSNSLQWLSDLSRAFRVLLDGKTAAMDHDTLFATVIRGRMDHVNKVGEGIFEIFRDGCWLVDQKASSLADWTKYELADIFGKPVYKDDVLLTSLPPVPLEKDEFISKVSSCVIKYMPMGNMSPLDGSAADLLLSKDGWILDFAENVVRRARPEDRLYMSMPHNMPVWDAPPELQEKVRHCCKVLHNYFEGGGNSLEEACSNPILEAKRVSAHRVVREVLEDAGLKVLRTFYETLGSLDMAIFFAVLNSSMVSGHLGFVEFPILTGPPNGGKTMLCNFAIKLLGGTAKRQPSNSYVESLPNNFLCVTARADADASRPVLNKLVNKRLAVVPECPALPINGDSTKPLLDSDDAGVNARANNSQRGDLTVFSVTWRLLVMRNTSVVVDPKTSFGMQNKILEIVTPYNWVADPDESDPLQKRADMNLKNDVKDNKLAPEFLFWCRELWPILGLSKTRHMCPPRPKQFVAIEEEAFEHTPEGRLKQFIATRLFSCKVEEAMPRTIIDDAIKNHCGDIDKHMLRQHKLGRDYVHQYRPKGGPHVCYYKVNGEPVTLKAPETSSAAASSSDAVL